MARRVKSTLIFSKQMMQKTYSEQGQAPHLWPIYALTTCIIVLTFLGLHDWHQRIHQDAIQTQAQLDFLKGRLKTQTTLPISQTSASTTTAIHTPPHTFFTLPGECNHWLYQFSPAEKTPSAHILHLTYQGPFLALMRCLEAHSQEWAFSKLELSQNNSNAEKPTQLWLEGPLSPANSTSASTVLPERLNALNAGNLPIPSQFPALFEYSPSQNPISVPLVLPQTPTWQWQGSVDNGTQRWALFSDGKVIHRLSIGDRWGTAGVITRIEMDGAWWTSPDGESHRAGIH
jgi:hypothetical protein